MRQPAQRNERPKQRYAATGTVLQTPTGDVTLCLGPILDSLPPAGCGGVPIANWRWDQVTGQQTIGRTTWGVFHVVGTWDGKRFTVVRVTDAPVGPPARRRVPDFRSPCPTPSGGWPVPDPTRASQAALEATSAAAGAQPDFAGLWISYLTPMGHNVAENPGEFVLNVAFTGDLPRHEAKLRTHWGGRLCVTRKPRTLRSLRKIQDELSGAVGKQLGLWMLTCGVDVIRGVVTMDVPVADAKTRAAVDRRYGKGVVELTGKLTPVP